MSGETDGMVDTPGKVTLWGVEVFAVTAEECSISGAARRLGASPSAVSQQISNLEAALGATLLDRSARPIALTPAGTLFLSRANTILNEAAEARAELALGNHARLTRLNLGMIEDFDADVTPGLLGAMGDELRETRFLLETGASHRLAELLDARALDVIVAADLGEDVADWMEVHPLLEEPFVAAVPKGLIGEASDAMAALSGLPMIQYTLRHRMGRQIAGHLAREGIDLDHRFEIDSYHAIMAMVSQGAGWTILTPLGFLRAGRFRETADAVPLPFAPMSRRISLTARAGLLGDMPARMAARLRPLISELAVAPAVARMPWLEGAMRLL